MYMYMYKSLTLSINLHVPLYTQGTACSVLIKEICLSVHDVMYDL